MDYKIVILTTYYRDYLKYYYSKNKDITTKTYREQFEHFMYDSFSWTGHYIKNFSKLGIEAHAIIGNAEPLQKAWALENGVNQNGLQLVLAQIQKYKPEIVLIQDPIVYNNLWVKSIKENIPSVQIVIGAFCSPFNSRQLEIFKSFDFIITCSKFFLDSFINSGLKAYLINHAFEASILEKLPSKKDYGHDLLFIGSLVATADLHDRRISTIEDLLNTDIDFEIYSNLNYDSWSVLSSKKIGYFLTKLLIKSGLNGIVDSSPSLKKIAVLNEPPHNPSYSSKLKKTAQPPLYGIDMYNKLSSASSVLNIHIGIAGAKYAANIRLFEVTGVGSCLVTDWKENLYELFVPDEEVVTFKTSEECIEKVKWLRDHPDERRKIAEAGQKRTLKDHTYALRVCQLDEIIRKELMS